MRGLSLSCRSGLLVSMAFIACVGCRAEPDAPPSQPASPPAARQDDRDPRQKPPASGSPQTGTAAAPQRPAPRGYSGPLPPLPDGPYPPARPLDVTRAVYAFAARSPEVLSYVPCFCGCENHGHRGNDDCFVASRDADGKPRWEMHGYV